MDPADSIFVVTMRALAGPRNSIPDGRRHDLLVFARADAETAAEAVALRGTALLGWDEPEILRTGEITQPDAVPEDLAPAMRRAELNGCAVIAYD